jgi:3-oxoacyl-[acyl-carrier protein] reductase
MRLQDKVALIAGAGGRQGTAVPLLFAREGASIVAAGLDGDEMSRLASLIESQRGRAAAIGADLTSESDAEAAVRLTLERFGRIDILYNNTGIYTDWEHRTGETDPAAWDRLIAVDLRTHFLTARLAVREMVRAGGGSIINVAAARAARLGGNVGYAAAKSAIIGMTKKMAREYAPDNVRVNCICPTNIQSAPDPENPQLPQRLVARDGTPDDVAYAALFLASDESAWITGIELVVDGGAEIMS